MRKWYVVFLLIAFSFSSVIKAQETTPDSLQVKERIQYIQSALHQSATGMDIWWYGWLGAYSAATIAQGTICLTSNDLARQQDMALGAGTTFLGAALQVLTPIHITEDTRLLATLPDSTLEEQMKKLAIAESLLKSNALKEKAGRSWQIHALNEGVNLGSGLITWLAFRRSVWDGVTNFLINSAITELQIWTQPTRTLKDYENYCRKYTSGARGFAYEPQPEYYLNTYPGGVTIGILF